MRSESDVACGDGGDINSKALGTDKNVIKSDIVSGASTTKGINPLPLLLKTADKIFELMANMPDDVSGATSAGGDISTSIQRAIGKIGQPAVKNLGKILIKKSDNIVDDVITGAKGSVSKVAAHLTEDVIDSYIQKAVNNPLSDKFILGVTGSYDTIAEDMGYTYFKMSDKAWDDLVTEAAQDYDEIWRVNEKFLDEQIGAGKEMLLSNDPFAKYLFDDGSKRFYQRELDYLTKNGYKFSVIEDGLWKATK